MDHLENRDDGDTMLDEREELTEKTNDELDEAKNSDTVDRGATTEVDEEDQWLQFSSKARQTWPDLNDQEFSEYEGQYDDAISYLEGKYEQPDVEAFQDWWRTEQHNTK